MVTDEELDPLRAEPEAFAGVIAERWEVYRTLFDREPVFIVNGRVPTLDEMTRRDSKQVTVATGGEVLTGAAGSGGIASGRARIVLDAADPEGLEPGDVLIARTDRSVVGAAHGARRPPWSSTSARRAATR